MIESKLKAKNGNSGQLPRVWISIFGWLELSPAPTYTRSIFVHGPLLPVFIPKGMGAGRTTSDRRLGTTMEWGGNRECMVRKAGSSILKPLPPHYHQTSHSTSSFRLQSSWMSFSYALSKREKVTWGWMWAIALACDFLYTVIYTSVARTSVVISRVRYIENLDITNLWTNNQSVRYMEVRDRGDKVD